MEYLCSKQKNLRRNKKREIKLFSLSNITKKELRDLDFQRIDKEIFEKCPNLSIDKAIMEKTKIAELVLPLDAGWSDIGSWNRFGKNPKRIKIIIL